MVMARGHEVCGGVRGPATGVIAALLLLLGAAAGEAQGQDAALRSVARSSVDTTLVTVGDRIRLTIEIDHPGDAVLRLPEEIDLAPFEVLDASATGPTANGEAARSILELTLAAFELGELEIPSFGVEVLHADGGVEVVETDAFGVEVVTVGADETGDIREIRGPLGIPVSALSILLTLLAVAFLLAATYWMYRRFRPDAAPEAVSKRAAPPRPAHELALEALAELEGSRLLERGQVKEYHIAASEIIRLYVERRYRVDALEMTTSEVLTALRGVMARDDLVADLRRFLDACDMVKFAKVRPTSETARATLGLGRSLVERSIPEVSIPDVDVAAAAGANAEENDTADLPEEPVGAVAGAERRED